MFEIVKNKIMYQASSYNYHIGQKIYFGRRRNYQAIRVFDKDFNMLNGENAAMFLNNKVQEKKKLNLAELKEINEVMSWQWNTAENNITPNSHLD